MRSQPLLTVAEVVAEMRALPHGEHATEAQLRRWATTLYSQGPWFYHWHWPKDWRVVQVIAEQAAKQAAEQDAAWRAQRARAEATAMLSDIAATTVRWHEEGDDA